MTKYARGYIIAGGGGGGPGTTSWGGYVANGIVVG